jgi:hypothetical protein
MAGTPAARNLPHNCILSASGYGSRAVSVTQISHGMSVVASEAKSRNGSAFYPLKRTSGSFGITIVFANWDESQAFSEWIEAYSRRISHPDTTGISPMRVVCQSRKFDKVAIPSGERGSTAMYGDSFDAITYKHVVNFEGARDSLGLNDPALSVFKQATLGWEGQEGSQHFYPQGDQQSGEQGDISSDAAWAAARQAVGSTVSKINLLIKGIN